MKKKKLTKLQEFKKKYGMTPLETSRKIRKECGEERERKELKKIDKIYGKVLRELENKFPTEIEIAHKNKIAYLQLARQTKSKNWYGIYRYKCICNWSKNDEYGFIPNTICKVHGANQKKLNKKLKGVKI